jgi:hypothetical protein
MPPVPTGRFLAMNSRTFPLTTFGLNPASYVFIISAAPLDSAYVITASNHPRRRARTGGTSPDIKFRACGRS